jgi:GNAT superfamily N-acetyltransferase
MRWRAADALLPAARPPEPGCGEQLTSTTGGRLVAAASCTHWAGQPEALELSWGAAVRFTLSVLAAGPDVSVPLADLLAAWRPHLRSVPAAADPDSAAVVLWPSRDITGIRALQHHGFSPRGVLAVRGHRPAAATGSGPEEPAGIAIRQAGPADLAEVVRLGIEVVRFDAHFGGVVERRSTAAALALDLRAHLDRPRPWTWLAERAGRPAGLLHAEPPETAAWVGPLVAAAPVSYVPLMFAEPRERATGLAPALADRYHRTAAEAGVAATLLHYEQANPLSAPFWGRQGYRPLWTSWEVRPAAAIR